LSLRSSAKLGRRESTGAMETKTTKNWPRANICSWNLLYQEFIDESKYSRCNPAHLAFEHRWSLMKKYFSSSEADVFLLQEVGETFFKDHLVPFFEAFDFDGKYQKKPKWGNAIFYRRSRFVMEWLESRSRALLCALRCRDNDHFVYVANVHLIGTPGRHDEQIAQVKSLFAQIEKRKAACGHSDPFSASTLVVGDFNSSSTAGTYRLLSDSKLPAGWKDAGGNVFTTSDVVLPVRLRSAYLEAHKSEPALTYSFNGEWTDCLDYCFYSPEKLEVSRVPAIDVSSKLFPSATQPSDHLPLLVEFKILVSPIRRPLKSSASTSDLKESS